MGFGDSGVDPKQIGGAHAASWDSLAPHYRTLVLGQTPQGVDLLAGGLLVGMHAEERSC